jgi:hypothetical protein
LHYIQEMHVPVLLALLFCKKARQIALVIDRFWEYFDLERFNSLETFQEIFPGMIMDFSEAQLQATYTTVSDHVQKNLTTLICKLNSRV